MRSISKLKFLVLGLAVVLTGLILGNSVIYAGTSTNSETGYTAILDDAAGFLDDSQEAELMELMGKITNKCNIICLTTIDNPYSTAEAYGDQYFKAEFGEYGDGLVFIIDKDNGEICLNSYNKTEKAINHGRCLSIVDNTYIYATAERGNNYFKCAYKTLEQCLALVDGGMILQPMKYITNIFLALVIAMIFNFFLAMTLSKPKKASMKQLLAGTFYDVKISNAHSQFLNQTKRYSPQSSGGSGHSGGGHHSGGGGHHSSGSHRI